MYWVDYFGLTATCPSNPPRSNNNWRPYPGDPTVYHCGFEGFLEVRKNDCDKSPIAECFYDKNKNLVDENHKYAGCRGTPDEYPVPKDWWNNLNILYNHLINDKGGPRVPSDVADNLGDEAYEESRRYFRENPTYRYKKLGRKVLRNRIR